MNKKSIIIKIITAPALFFLFTSIVSGSIPQIRTPLPVIYLEDNLDEKDNLGYCIDTVGRGFAEKLHAHSCKPRGGDVQFKYDNDEKRIQSATFEGKCAEVIEEIKDGSRLGLFDCSSNSSLQRFDYDFNSKEFRPGLNKNLCLGVAEKSRKAGPFMARNLRIYTCDKLKDKFKKWVIKN